MLISYPAVFRFLSLAWKVTDSAVRAIPLGGTIRPAAFSLLARAERFVWSSFLLTSAKKFRGTPLKTSGIYLPHFFPMAHLEHFLLWLEHLKQVKFGAFIKLFRCSFASITSVICFYSRGRYSSASGEVVGFRPAGAKRGQIGCGRSSAEISWGGLSGWGGGRSGSRKPTH